MSRGFVWTAPLHEEPVDVEEAEVDADLGMGDIEDEVEAVDDAEEAARISTASTAMKRQGSRQIQGYLPKKGANSINPWQSRWFIAEGRCLRFLCKTLTSLCILLLPYVFSIFICCSDTAYQRQNVPKQRY